MDEHWYSKQYKEKHLPHLKEKKNEEELKRKIQIANKENEQLAKLDNLLDTIEKEVKEDFDEAKKFFMEPKHVRILKIIALLIPFFIILFLIYSNFVMDSSFNSFYDIGGEENYLSPLNRISGIINYTNGSYRNLTNGLVYFNVDIPRGSEIVDVEFAFKDYFPNNTKLSIGAKDEEFWHYKYNSVYNRGLEKLLDLYKNENVYLVNENLVALNFDELKSTKGIVIATDKDYHAFENFVEDFEEKDTVINTTLRSGHKFYIYLDEKLNLSVKKQDINWYNGSDELIISLYDLDKNLISNTTIEDDGIVNINKKEKIIQESKFIVNDLLPGVYILEFSNFDGLIREIRINTNKIVSERLFLANNELYGVSKINSTLYFNNYRDSQIKFNTYHFAGIQKIYYDNETFNFSKEDESIYMNVSKGEHKLIFPKNDIIVSGPFYFAFNRENYFEPFTQRIIPLSGDFEWIKNNVDYIYTDYEPPFREGEWSIGKTRFNITRDDLYIKNNKLSLVFNAPHLSKEEFSNNTIPIDWINITVYKPGVLF